MADMDGMQTLEFAVNALQREVEALDDSQMGLGTNCDPWTVRQLASHALDNQLFWGGIVTGQQHVLMENVKAAVPHEGDLADYAGEVSQRAMAMWGTEGVLPALHVTPFGELPGAVIISFATIDALCHAWDLSASLGRPWEFPDEAIPTLTALVEMTCTDAVRAGGLIKDVAEVGPDATVTDKLMAQAGRTRNY
jgi:uncharacterized protein (TIGR03086 family)